MSKVAELFAEHYGQTREQEMSLQDYLLACRDDPSMYANVAERMLKAILRSVDDAAVVTEHEATNRRNRDNGGNKCHIDLLMCGLSHAFNLPPMPCCSFVYFETGRREQSAQ